MRSFLSLRFAVLHTIFACLAIGFFLFPQHAQAFSVTSTWGWNRGGSGGLNAIVTDLANNRIYIGGSFTYIGPTVGSVGVFDIVTHEQDFTLPYVAGPTLAAVSDGSGGWYVGGSFGAVDGVSRNRIAHITPAGDLDTAWNPDANGVVRSLVVTGTTLFVSGDFTSIGGAARNRIAALDTSTGLATSWDPNASGTGVYIMVYSTSTNTIYAGGTFSAIGGQTRNNLAALDASTGLATSWDPNSDGRVTGLALSTSTIFAAGSFTTMGGNARSRLAELRLSDASTTIWDAGVNSTVEQLFLSTSTLFVTGSYTTIGGQSRRAIAELNAVTASATAFNAAITSGQVIGVAVSGTQVYVGGLVTAGIGGNTARINAAVLDLAGVATDFDISAGTTARGFAFYGTKVLVFGDFTSVGGRQRNRLAALDATTGRLMSWNPNASGIVRAIATSGTSIYVGGDFTSVGGQTRNRIAELDMTTGSSTSWNPNATSGQVNTIAVSGTNVYVGGTFTTVGGSARNRIAAIDVSTGTSTSWNPNAGNTVNTIILRDSSAYVGGAFTTIGGNTRNRIAELDTTIGSSTSWNPNATSGAVNTLIVTTSTVYAGGTFTTIGGNARNRLAALDRTTGSSTFWNPNASSDVNSIAMTTSTMYLGGAFTTIGGLNRDAIAAVSLSTGLPTTWIPTSTVFSSINNNAMALLGPTLLAGTPFELFHFYTPVLEVTTSTGSGSESITSGSVPIILTEPFTETVTANYTVAGTATGGGTDYALSNGTVTIPAGATTFSIPFTVTNGNTAEDTETIIVELSSPQPAYAIILGNATYTYSILDTDIAAPVSTGGGGLGSSGSAPPETHFGSTMPLAPFFQVPVHALVKLPDDGTLETQFDSAVYYIGTDGKRHAFPNEKAYFTWYDDFSQVQIVSDTILASVPLGANVTYKPGKKMVKFTTEPKVYAVAKGGVLRWIISELVASQLYGPLWNTKIDDISDAFYPNYLFGADVTGPSDYDPAQAEASVQFPSDSLQP